MGRGLVTAGRCRNVIIKFLPTCVPLKGRRYLWCYRKIYINNATFLGTPQWCSGKWVTKLCVHLPVMPECGRVCSMGKKQMEWPCPNDLRPLYPLTYFTIYPYLWAYYTAYIYIYIYTHTHTHIHCMTVHFSSWNLTTCMEVSCNGT